MTDRDRLAADLHAAYGHKGTIDVLCACSVMADRLIALGWTRLDEDRLARALVAAMVAIGWDADAAGIWVRARLAHPAFKWAYREDTK